MAIVDGWLKRTRKSAGNLTFAKWKGLTTARQKSAGPPPGTVPQKVLDVRAQLRKMKDIYDMGVVAIRPGFNEWTDRMGVWSAFNKFNWTPASDYSVPGAPTVVYENVVFSQGAILPTDFTATADESTGFINTSWDPTPSGNQLSDDIPVVVTWNNTQQKWLGTVVYPAEGPLTRADGGSGNIVISSGDAVAGDILYIYMFFYGHEGSDNEGKASNTTRISVTVVA